MISAEQDIAVLILIGYTYLYEPHTETNLHKKCVRFDIMSMSSMRPMRPPPIATGE